MCGILGQINIKNREVLPLPLDLLKYRGPDGAGEWINDIGSVYLGHTRLSILEPTPAGKQPMHDTSGRFTITFNGEIYNHLQLRELLPDIHWRGNSDTETLVELLALRGIEALSLLKGMFAFAIHDSFDNSILLVRDRLGIKPLWIHSTEEAYTFSSEVRPLLTSGKFSLNAGALGEYIGFGHFPGTGEIFIGISCMPPGSWMKISSTGNITERKWWTGESSKLFKPHKKSDAVQKVHQLVSTAIEEHLISDVGVGAFLSGGIDSSIVTLIAGKILGKNLRTFTVGFPQSEYDERLIARKVADKVGSEHFELEIGEEECLGWVKEAVHSLDLPSVDAINTFIVSKAVRDQGLKVALSGLGGDELFGGYPAFKKLPSLSWLNQIPPLLKSKVLNAMPPVYKEKLGGITDFSISELTLARRRFASVASLRAMGFTDGTPVIPAIPENFDKMSRISWAEIYGYMIPMLLRDSDQMSMAVGLEIRVPFLDHKLVEEVLNFPQKFKRGHGIKPLLVKAFANDLPPEVYNRPKKGFALPMDEWMRGPLKEFTAEGIKMASNYLNLSEPLTQRKKFEKGSLHWTRVWNWCILGYWLSGQQANDLVWNESVVLAGFPQ